MNKYKDILNNVNKLIEELKDNDIQVGSLNKAIDELYSHAEDVEKVEKDLDQIKRQVIVPILEELDKNRKAGLFSIWGFWVGAISIVVSIFSVILNESSIFNNYFSGQVAEGSKTAALESIENESFLYGSAASIERVISGFSWANDIEYPAVDSFIEGVSFFSLKGDGGIFELKISISHYYEVETLSDELVDQLINSVKNILFLSSEKNLSFEDFEFSSIDYTNNNREISIRLQYPGSEKNVIEISTSSPSDDILLILPVEYSLTNLEPLTSVAFGNRPELLIRHTSDLLSMLSGSSYFFNLGKTLTVKPIVPIFKDRIRYAAIFSRKK